MIRPRYRKLMRDVWTQRGRMVLMMMAIGVSLLGIGTVLGAYALLTREMAASYLGTRPASATLEIPGGISERLLAEVRGHPLVAEAEAREVVIARARVGHEQRRMLLFAIDDFRSMRLNTFTNESGAWPPALGSMLIERSAQAMLQAHPGQSVWLKTPHGPAREVAVSGLVHDPGLAPAWQERSGYGYITRQTLAWLGEDSQLQELRIELRGSPLPLATIESQSRLLVRWLADRGTVVRELRIPPPAQHPHQRQMTTILVMMLCFGALALVLSAIVVATSLAAMLARQVREIGVMKTLGASSSQLAAMYAMLVGCLGATAAILSVPLAAGGTRLLSGAISRLLNFELRDTSIPTWVAGVQLLAGVLVPLLLAAVPIGRASRKSVRQAMDDYGVAPESIRSYLALLPSWLRNPARRPARLALTLGLLATGGAMFMMAFNVRNGWQGLVDKIHETRSYDVEIRLQQPYPKDLAARLRSLPSVRAVEPWGYAPAAFHVPGEINLVHTYPDRGHGSLSVMAPPPDARLVHLPLLAGRWLAPGDRDAVVLNHMAMAQLPGLHLGDTVRLSIQGNSEPLRLVGVVQEIGSPAIAYVTQRALSEIVGTSGISMLRVASAARSGGERAELARELDDVLTSQGVAVASVAPLSELRTAIGDHIVVLLRSLVAMAVILGIVGSLGLASSMAVSVLERTRELAVMKVLGASNRRVTFELMREGLVMGVSSFPIALGLALPLTWLVDSIIGSLGFLAPLPLVFSPGAALAWFSIVVSVSLAATALPAHRAARQGLRDGLAQP